MNELIEINIGNDPIEIELPGGARGLKGDTGSQGPAGPQGPQGLQGPQGIKGDTGEKGADGISPIITTQQTTNGATITITDAQGTNTVTLTNGAKGDKGDQGDRGLQGEQGIQGVQGEKGETGSQGPQGPQGTPFIIKKTYQSIAEMQADFNNMEENDYVMIASSVELEDNAKLYMRGSSQWIFISDFSGATGIQGEQGPQGIQGPQGEQGPQGIQGIQGIQGVQGEQGIQGYSIGSVAKTSGTSTPGTTDTYTMYLDDTNNTPVGTFNVYNGEDGCTIDDEVTSNAKTWSSAEINKNATITEEGQDFTIKSIEAPLIDLKIYGNTENNNNVTGNQQISITGKNRFNIGINTYQNNGVSINTTNSEIYLDGTSAGANFLLDWKQMGKFKKGTYTVKGIKKSGSYVRPSNLDMACYIANLDTLSNIITVFGLSGLERAGNVSFTLADDTNLALRMFCNGAGIEFDDLIIDFELEKGTTTTEYEQYKGNTYQIGLGSIELSENDYIYKSNNKWYKHDNANSTEIEITNTTLISQLEAVSTIDGTNNITVTSSGVVPDIEVTAYTNSFNGNIKYLYKKSNDLSNTIGDISTALSSLVTVGGGS